MANTLIIFIEPYKHHIALHKCQNKAICFLKISIHKYPCIILWRNIFDRMYVCRCRRDRPSMSLGLPSTTSLLLMLTSLTPFASSTCSAVFTLLMWCTRMRPRSRFWNTGTVLRVTPHGTATQHYSYCGHSRIAVRSVSPTERAALLRPADLETNPPRVAYHSVTQPSLQNCINIHVTLLL